MNLTCKSCEKEKPVEAFSVHSDCVSGYDMSRCKACKKAARDWSKVPYEKRMYNRTKERAKRLGREFTLELEDIVLPTHCPVFNMPFIYNDKEWTWSIDRKDNSKGYTKENILIVSNKANRLKNNATMEDLQRVINFYRGCEIDEEMFKS